MNEPKVCEPYKDGNPLGRPAHRHINPDGSEGGWVAERAHVAPGVHVGPQATIYGGTGRGCRLACEAGARFVLAR